MYHQINSSSEFLEISEMKHHIKADKTTYLADVLIIKPLLLANKHLGLASLIVLVMFQILILLPYFLTQGRKYGSK
jgi:hypothetical protein